MSRVSVGRVTSDLWFKSKAYFLLAITAPLSACVSLAAIEPVPLPPVHYRVDVVSDIEFLPPNQIGRRCAERRGNIIGLPVMPAMACADTQLISMPDPCRVFAPSEYAETLCESVQHQTVASLTTASISHEHKLRRIEFIDPSDIPDRCVYRGGVEGMSDVETVKACRNSALVSIGNPCTIDRPDWYSNLLCHELGHVNGWPANHSRGTPPIQFSSLGRAQAHPAKEAVGRLELANRRARERDPIVFID